MKLRAQRKDGKIVKITLVSEDPGDVEVLEALWNHDVSREKIVYRKGYVVLQAKVSPYPRH